MNYENISGILKDIVEFIKSFTATLKAFIEGFKSELVVEKPEADGE